MWSLELAEPEARVRSIKNCQLAYSAGGCVMNVLPGPLKELTGTYVTSYAIMAGLALAKVDYSTWFKWGIRVVGCIAVVNIVVLCLFSL